MVIERQNDLEAAIEEVFPCYSALIAEAVAQCPLGAHRMASRWALSGFIRTGSQETRLRCTGLFVASTLILA